MDNHMLLMQEVVRLRERCAMLELYFSNDATTQDALDGVYQAIKGRVSSFSFTSANLEKGKQADLGITALFGTKSKTVVMTCDGGKIDYNSTDSTIGSGSVDTVQQMVDKLNNLGLAHDNTPFEKIVNRAHEATSNGIHAVKKATDAAKNEIHKVIGKTTASEMAMYSRRIQRMNNVY